LPYSENGLTFSTMPGTNSAYVANGHLGSGTNFIPIHIRDGHSTVRSHVHQYRKLLSDVADRVVIRRL
jgi:hypothetical protein